MKHSYAKRFLLAALLLPALHYAQVITGTVVDETKQPLPGAAVYVVEQQTGTNSDMDGKFIVPVKPGELTVEISFIGYSKLTRKVTVASGQTLNLGSLSLSPEESKLDEIIVVGYGVQRKREVTGSMVKLDSKKLNDMPTPTFEAAFQGKAAGVQIVTGSGVAGSGAVVRIRGVASISASADPLYVVDGIPITQDNFLQGNSGGFNNNPLATINPNDIESIEILKDAAATAIYGSRGANGVILITTKRGKGKELKFNFSTRLGTSNPTQRPQMLNSQEWLQMYKEAWANDGKVGTPTLPAGITWEQAEATNTDWVDQTITTGFKQRYDLSAQMAKDKYNFYVGGSYDLNESYLIGNSYERLSGRVNGDYRFSKKFEVGLSTSLVRGTNNRIDNAWSGGLGSAMSTALPIFPVIDTATGDYWNGAGSGNNPVGVRDNKIWRNRELRSISNMKLTYRPFKNFSLNASGSLDHMTLREDQYNSEWIIGQPNQANAFRNQQKIINYNLFLTASYLQTIKEVHSLTYLIGAESQNSNTYNEFHSDENGNSLGNGITDSSVTAPYFDSDLEDRFPINTSIIDPQSTYRFVSWFGRVNYSYKDKYLAQATLRADGSSRFGRNKRYGFFPSLSLGWIVSEESFFTSKKINYLKVKSSLGYTGNAQIPGFQYQGGYNVGGASYGGSPIRFPVRLENPNIQWENSRVFDISVEAAFLNDRITTELAFYDKYSSNVFLGISTPRNFGFGNYWDNVGEILNRGVELTIKSRNLVGDLTWTTEFNIANNYNELVNIGGYSEDAVSGGTNDTRTVVGKPVGTNYLVRFSHVDRENGRPVYLDRDGNQTYEWNPDDRVAVGNVLPDAVGGINNTFAYKGFDFSFLFAFVIGGDIYDSSSKRQLGPMSIDNGLWNLTPQIYDRWQQPGDDAMYPRLTTETANLGSTTPWINTDLWLHDGSYLRLRNLSIGYTLPTEKVKKWKMDYMRVYIVGTNLLTFTRYPGLDPEIARDFENNADRNMSVNITYLTPPQERTYNIGVDITF